MNVARTTPTPPPQHTYVASKTAPGTCVVCHCIRKNWRHPQDGTEVEQPRDAQQRAAGDVR